jgi:hypothetical protein
VTWEQIFDGGTLVAVVIGLVAAARAWGGLTAQVRHMDKTLSGLREDLREAREASDADIEELRERVQKIEIRQLSGRA